MKTVTSSAGVWKSYDDTSGLAHNVAKLAIDTEGFLWAGTRMHGLSRFDGRRFDTFREIGAMTNNAIVGLHADRHGRVWVLSWLGAIAVWEHGHFRMAPEKRTPDRTQAARHCFEDRHGRLWLIRDGAGFLKWSGDQFEPDPNWSRSGEWGLWRACTSRQYDAVGHTDTHVLFLRDGEIVRREAFPSDRRWSPSSILEDRHGAIWIGTMEGLLRFADGQWTMPGREIDLHRETIWCVTEDREGAIWLGTFTKSACRLRDGTWESFTGKAGPASVDVANIVVDDTNSVWFACNHGGLSHLDTNVTTVSDDAVHEAMIQDHAGRLWWGAGRELVVQTPNGRQIRQDAGARVTGLAADNDNGIWVVTADDPVLRCTLDDDKLTMPACSAENADGSLLWGAIICARDGRIIATSDSHGVLTFNGRGFAKGHSETRVRPRNILAICEDVHGDIWVACGTPVTIAVLRKGATEFSWVGFSADDSGRERMIEDSEPSEDQWIQSASAALATDSQGRLWIATDDWMRSCVNGISTTPASADNLGTFHVRSAICDSHDHVFLQSLGGGLIRHNGRHGQVLTTDDGLPSNSVVSVVQKDAETYWIATYGGICRYRSRSEEVPRVKIESVETDRLWEGPPAVVETFDRVPSIRIAYRGVCLNTARLRYHYMLEGHDPDWRSSWSEEATYRDVPPGRYAFKVIAVNRDLVTSPEPAVVEILVTPDPDAERLGELELTVQQKTAALTRALEELTEARKIMSDTDRIKTVGQLAGGVVHDINNCLFPVLSLSEMLIDDPEILSDTDTVSDMILDIRAAARSATSTIDRLKDFYRKHPTRQEALVDLSEIARDAITLTKPRWQNEMRAKGRTVDVVMRLAEVPMVSGYAEQLQQVLANLILNALDAMGEEGGRLEVSSFVNDGNVCVDVADSGSGMTEEARERCLEPFFTTKGVQGTGMGLATARATVVQHGGEMTVRSQLGQGTTMTICIPVATEGAASSSESRPKKDELAPYRVLLVDDDPLCRKALKSLLSFVGQSVVAVAGGKEGLERLHAEEFDLMITDNAMPSMSGEELARRAKEDRPGLPIIMITGFADTESDESPDPAAAAPKHIDAMIRKPLVKDQLRRSIASVMSRNSETQDSLVES